ncbi:MAG: hypothetical protein DRN05_01905 [Thermoplasmata archaeon]|nr:MAG: hypothetical protein DRN05_01905 [Thermoplasmata archaeon]
MKLEKTGSRKNHVYCSEKVINLIPYLPFLSMYSTCKYYCYRKRKNMETAKHGMRNRRNRRNIGTIKLVIFDMDGVLVDTISSWRYIHNYFGTNNQRSVDLYLRGEIDDLEFIRRDISLWKQNNEYTTRDKIADILYRLPVMYGSKKCIATLRNHNIKTAIVSAGLDILAEKISRTLGIDYFLANGLKTDKDGRITGEGILRVRLMHKDEAVKKIMEKYDIPPEYCAAVGNSCFDIPMFETCGLGIAFNPEDECVKKAADVVVKEKNLAQILPHIPSLLNKDI